MCEQAGKSGRLQTVLTLLARPVRLVRSQPQFTGQAEPNPSLFDSDPERQLWEALQAVKPSIQPSMPVGAFLEACEPLAAPVASYFDNVRPAVGGPLQSSSHLQPAPEPETPLLLALLLLLLLRT